MMYELTVAVNVFEELAIDESTISWAMLSTSEIRCKVGDDGHMNFKVIRRFTVNLCPSQLGLKQS